MSDLISLDQIAITGATGFIGRHLVHKLLSIGSKPMILARKKKDNDWIQELNCGDRRVELDLTESGRFKEVLKDLKPNILIHLAGTRGRDQARAAEIACEEVNVRATSNLLSAAMSADVQRIVIVGSAEEYGNQLGPQNESLPIRATSAYGVSKGRATEEALRMHAEEGCPVVVIRPFSVYGPGQPKHMFIAEAVDAAVRNVEFRMSEGTQKRDLIFVEDVVRGVIAAAGAPDVDGRIINLGSGTNHALRDVARQIWDLANATAPLLVGARRAPAEEQYDTWADIKLARRVLDWEPAVSLENGLVRTINYAKEQLGQRVQTCQAT